MPEVTALRPFDSKRLGLARRATLKAGIAAAATLWLGVNITFSATGAETET
jgi:hypothetical protein